MSRQLFGVKCKKGDSSGGGTWCWSRKSRKKAYYLFAYIFGSRLSKILAFFNIRQKKSSFSSSSFSLQLVYVWFVCEDL